MRALAGNPFCVWFNGKMRTFKTLTAARAYATKTRASRIGQWSNAEKWWVEITPSEVAAKLKNA